MRQRLLIMLFVLLICALGSIPAVAFDYSRGPGGSRDVRAARVLCQSAAPVPIGGTLAETTLMTCPIPPLGPNDALRLCFTLSYTAGTNSKTITPKLNSTNFYSVARTGATQALDVGFFTVYNRGVSNSQMYWTSTGPGQNATIFTMAVDTSAPTTFSINAQTSLETGFTPTQANMSGSGSVVTVVQTAHGLITGDFIKAAGSSTSGYNVNPVAVTRIDANTFTYPGTGTGTPTTSPLIQRYSVIRLDAYTVELVPRAN